MSELAVKGGIDFPLQRQNPTNVSQREAGSDMINNPKRLEKDVDMLEQSLPLEAFVPKNGFHPVYLVSRSKAFIERSLALTRPDMTPLQLKKRQRYTIDTSLEKHADEMFREIVRPRQGLLDSEVISLGMLKRQIGADEKRLLQLPMVESESERLLAKMKSGVSQWALLGTKSKDGDKSGGNMTAQDFFQLFRKKFGDDIQKDEDGFPQPRPQDAQQDNSFIPPYMRQQKADPGRQISDALKTSRGGNENLPMIATASKFRVVNDAAANKMQEVDAGPINQGQDDPKLQQALSMVQKNVNQGLSVVKEDKTILRNEEVKQMIQEATVGVQKGATTTVSDNVGGPKLQQMEPLDIPVDTQKVFQFVKQFGEYKRENQAQQLRDNAIKYSEDISTEQKQIIEAGYGRLRAKGTAPQGMPRELYELSQVPTPTIPSQLFQYPREIRNMFYSDYYAQLAYQLGQSGYPKNAPLFVDGVMMIEALPEALQNKPSTQLAYALSGGEDISKETILAIKKKYAGEFKPDSVDNKFTDIYLMVNEGVFNEVIKQNLNQKLAQYKGQGAGQAQPLTTVNKPMLTTTRATTRSQTAALKLDSGTTASRQAQMPQAEKVQQVKAPVIKVQELPSKQEEVKAQQPKEEEKQAPVVGNDNQEKDDEVDDRPLQPTTSNVVAKPARSKSQLGKLLAIGATAIAGLVGTSVVGSESVRHALQNVRFDPSTLQTGLTFTQNGEHSSKIKSHSDNPMLDSFLQSANEVAENKMKDYQVPDVLNGADPSVIHSHKLDLQHQLVKQETRKMIQQYVDDRMSDATFGGIQKALGWNDYYTQQAMENLEFQERQYKFNQLEDEFGKGELQKYADMLTDGQGLTRQGIVRTLTKIPTILEQVVVDASTAGVKLLESVGAVEAGTSEGLSKAYYGYEIFSHAYRLLNYDVFLRSGGSGFAGLGGAVVLGLMLGRIKSKMSRQSAAIALMDGKFALEANEAKKQASRLELENAALNAQMRTVRDGLCIIQGAQLLAIEGAQDPKTNVAFVSVADKVYTDMAIQMGMASVKKKFETIQQKDSEEMKQARQQARVKGQDIQKILAVTEEEAKDAFQRLPEEEQRNAKQRMLNDLNLLVIADEDPSKSNTIFVKHVQTLIGGQAPIPVVQDIVEKAAQENEGAGAQDAPQPKAKKPKVVKEVAAPVRQSARLLEKKNK